MNHAIFSLPGWETLGILVAVIVMLVSNKVRVDMIGVFIFLALGITGLVKEKDLFNGFGNDTIIIIATMLALGSGLVRSGVTDRVASWITHVGGKSERRLLAVLMVIGGIFSSLISDLAFVSIFLPVVLGFERRLKFRASRILLPLAIASMMGGLMTMVGSASNIIANQTLTKFGLRPLALFTIAPLGFTLMVAAIIFVLLFGKYLLPNFDRATDQGITGIQEYLTELRITKESSWDDKMLQDIQFFKEHGINVVRILRDKPVNFPTASSKIQRGDILLVEAPRDDLLKLSGNSNFSIQSEIQDTLNESEFGLAGEAIIRQSSQFENKTLGQLNFREIFQVTVLALWRNGQAITQRLAEVRLKAGDMLLLQGPKESMEALSANQGLLMLTKKPHSPVARSKGKWTVAILALTFLLAATGLLPISIAGILGLALMVLLRILRTNHVYRAIDWHILVFVAAMIPLGDAMTKTGILADISDVIVNAFGHHGPYLLLAACFAITALFTQVMSNTPTTLLLTPVVISTAQQLHYSPIPFVITVIVAVTASPLTYISHKVFLVIMGPGRYRYLDYAKLGAPLTVVFFGITMGIVPWLWPF